jgi:predicted nucleic acid-binding protein
LPTPRKQVVAEIWVVNASPLISLSKIGRVDLLLKPGRSLIVPEAVREEVLRGGEDDPARRWLEAGVDVNVRTATVDPQVGAWSLGAGESAVLSLSMELGALAMLDDREARAAARTLGVRCSGTLGIVVQAARDARIAAAAPLIRALRSAGLHLSDRAVADALRRYLNEDWLP